MLYASKSEHDYGLYVATASATKMAGRKQNPCMFSLSPPRPDGPDRRRRRRRRRRGRRPRRRPVVLLLVLAECLLDQVLQVMEPPLLLRGCVSPQGSHLGFVVHDRVKYLRTPREETLPDFHCLGQGSHPSQVFFLHCERSIVQVNCPLYLGRQIHTRNKGEFQCSIDLSNVHCYPCLHRKQYSC